MPNILPPEHPLGKFNTVTELLESPERWCQGANFKDAENNVVFSVNNATKCCIEGAMSILGMSQFEINQFKIKENRLYNFNDTHTHVEVLELCKKLNI